MENEELIRSVVNDFGVEIPNGSSREEMLSKLSANINLLINTNFDRLISLLYRLDISELRLKKELEEKPGNDAGDIIAGMIVERELQKLQSRQSFRRDNNIAEEDRW